MNHPMEKPANAAALTIVREFAAARERVWQAFTDPAAIVRWLGPVDWPASEVQADVREGGAWRACLRAVGRDECLWQSGRYVTIEAPRRLCFTFAWEGDNHEDGLGPQTMVTVVLEEMEAARTRMTFTQAGLSSEQSAGGHTRGWNSCFDRLVQHLAAA